MKNAALILLLLAVGSSILFGLWRHQRAKVADLEYRRTIHLAVGKEAAPLMANLEKWIPDKAYRKLDERGLERLKQDLATCESMRKSYAKTPDGGFVGQIGLLYTLLEPAASLGNLRREAEAKNVKLDSEGDEETDRLIREGYEKVRKQWGEW